MAALRGSLGSSSQSDVSCCLVRSKSTACTQTARLSTVRSLRSKPSPLSAILLKLLGLERHVRSRSSPHC